MYSLWFILEFKTNRTLSFNEIVRPIFFLKTLKTNALIDVLFCRIDVFNISIGMDKCSVEFMCLF